MKGTIIANNGAITMASGCNLEGRLLSTAGAISFGPVNATRPACITSVPLSAYNPCYNIILGSVGGFVQFTSTGAVGNTGISNLTGDIGSDAGAISGFGTSSVTGSSYNADAVTAQAKIDLQISYLQLSSIPVTDASHTPAFGGGEVLTTGVYLISGAGSLAGNLTLDAEGDPDAVFIFRFGGALTTGAASEIILANGASSCNIFWVAEGAISMAAATIMKGTLIANNAANSMAAGGELEGRMLSTTGAIAIDQINASKVVSCHCPPPVPLPIVLLSFTGTCEENKISLEWVTASENNNDYFSIEKSIDGINWENIVNMDASGNSSSKIYYIYVDLERETEVAYYKLKQTDFNGVFEYFDPISVQICGTRFSELYVYPNPLKDKQPDGIYFLHLNTGHNKLVEKISIVN